MRGAAPVSGVAEDGRDARTVVIAVLMPHAPVLVPEVGGGRLSEVTSTVEAMRRVAHSVVDANPDSVVLVSPHSPREPQAFGIWQGARFHGSLEQFGADKSGTGVSLPADLDLREEIEAQCRSAGIPTWGIPGQPLDHGAVVPLWFLQDEGWCGPTVLLSLNYPGVGMLEELGTVIARAGAALGRRIALIASGDMSHRLQPGAPAGYHPDAWRSDERFIQLLRAGDFNAVRRIDPVLLESAAEDATESTRVALAAVQDDPRGHEVLSYEGPFGVGYGVAILHESSGCVRSRAAEAGDILPSIARESLAAYFSASKTPPPPPPNEYLRGRHGIFVTIRERSGLLRGCVGTLHATTDNLVSETWRMARDAALRDSRFSPVEAGELPGLKFEVSVLHPAEPVESTADLDPAEFGVVVWTGDGRHGVLLPGIPEIDSVDEQLAIARKKGAIHPDEPVTIERFRIDKFHEET